LEYGLFLRGQSLGVDRRAGERRGLRTRAGFQVEWASVLGVVSDDISERMQPIYLVIPHIH
jgi:hypothetical protein